MRKAILIILTMAGFASGAEMEMTDRLSVDGTSLFKSTAVFSGSVGIGTTSPLYLLDVYSPTVDAVVAFRSRADSTPTLVRIVGNNIDLNTEAGQLGFSPYTTYLPYASIGGGWSDTTSHGFLAFHVSADYGATSPERMRINHAGNVGIGTTNPAVTLDLAGTDAVKIPVGTTAQRPANPAAGMMRFNSSINQVEFYDGTNWRNVYPVIATGGTVTEVGGYRIHTFTGNGTFAVTRGGNVEVLVVAGGGGTAGNTNVNGGGGGGGVIYNNSFVVSAGNITITVGSGGIGGSNGADSVFSTLIAAGGGKGGTEAAAAGNGGSGGGATWGQTTPGTGTLGQGYNGGGAVGGENYPSGGGGGAGSVGQTPASSLANGGAGGNGYLSLISGTATYYGGGGGGGSWLYATAVAPGGWGGGGNGGHHNGGETHPTSGAVNTGGGGGGTGLSGTATNGGSGIVIVRYPI